MSSSIAIITGASRGMGQAIAQLLLASGWRVLGLSRHADASLAKAGAEQWCVDLADSQPVAERLRGWLQCQDAAACSQVALINNAAVLGTPGPLAHMHAVALQQVIRVGLEAPLVLTSAFLSATAAWACPRRVLNISSGLGRRPMAGLTAYCAAKAGLDHFSRAMALEQSGNRNPASIVSLAPGVIETGMQAQLRGADTQAFPEHHRFASLHAAGALDSPAVAARKVVDVLLAADFGMSVIADVRD